MAGTPGRAADRRSRRFLRPGRALFAGHPTPPARQTARGPAGGGRGSVPLPNRQQAGRILARGRPRGSSDLSKVVLFGNARFAETNHFYLNQDSPHEVVAFTVDRTHIRQPELLGCPVVPFEEITQHYPPEEYLMAVPLGLKRVNHMRAEKFQQAQAKGYRFVSYVSSTAVTWPDAVVGENCFVYESVVMKPFARLGSDIIVEAGSVVGHHTEIRDHCFLGPHSVVLGECTVEPYCVIG